MAAFSIFAVAGAAFLIPFAVPFARRVGTSWQQVPATILWSGVGTHSGSDGATYSVDVLYEYDVGGDRYRANRYRLFAASSSGETDKQRIVEGLAPGTRVDAWVDPDDPSRAVLELALGGFMLFSILPLVFLAVGIVGMVAMARRKDPALATGATWLPTQEEQASVGASLSGVGAGPGPARAGMPPSGESTTISMETRRASGPITLQPARSRVGSFLGLLFFTLIWNGFIGAVIYLMWRDGKFGNEGCVTAFLGVFALVGLLLLISLPRQFLALFNPRAELTLSAPAAPGMPVAVSWRFLGNASRIRRLTLHITGREQATYRRGTTTTTQNRTFARLSLLDTTDRTQIVAGETLLALPEDTMHSFDAPRNKVIWILELRGEIPGWPDIEDDVTLTVYPAELVV